MPNTHEHDGGRDSSPEGMLARQLIATERRLAKLETGSTIKGFLSVADRDAQWDEPRGGMMCVIGPDLYCYTASGWRRYPGTTTVP